MNQADLFHKTNPCVPYTLQEISEREFLGELDALGRVRHRNLVSLRGYCVTDVECFLVLDYAEKGNLDSALRSSESTLLSC
jgi:hypothetical protein